MPYLLDTNHWIQLLKGNCPALARRLDTVPPDQVWLCSVVKEELFHGAEKYGNREARLAKLRDLLHATAPYRLMMRPPKKLDGCVTPWRFLAR